MKLQQLFGVKNQANPPALTSDSGRSLPSDENSPISVRRQLIQVLLRDTAKRAGIPPDWLDCQMLMTSSPSGNEGMYLQLIMKRWDLRLLTYAAAFQNALLADIMRFEPRANEWLHGISWQLNGGGDSCPQQLPDPTLWRQPPGAR